MDWNRYMHTKFFITDLGTISEEQTEGIMKTGRYAVWAPIANSDRHQIVEVSDDLEILVGKYHITGDRICTLVRYQQAKTGKEPLV